MTLRDNGSMAVSSRQRRMQRAQELITQHPYAAEILEFYVQIARFQENLDRSLSATMQSAQVSISRELSSIELSELSGRFESFLDLTVTHGPERLRTLSSELISRRRDFWSELLQGSWCASSQSDAQGYLAQTFLQPYAERLRSRIPSKAVQTTRAICPFCHRKPSVGVLRQMGDGAARSLICSFCLGEWEFRRLICPGCGEENDRNLLVFTAADCDYIRVEACETCKTYIKTVDLTKNGNADPIVDELASVPLDLWARKRGYAKLQNNILGM